MDKSGGDMMDEDNELIPNDSLMDPPEVDEEEAQKEESSELSQEEERARNELEEQTDEYQSEAAPSGMGNTRLLWSTLKGVTSAKKVAPLVAIVGFIVLILALFASMIGSLIQNNREYIAPRCTQMSVSFENGEDVVTESLSMEQYIVSHIYSATKDFKNINPNLYKTLAVVINTNVQSTGICSETIAPEVDDIYTFEILDKEAESYQEILNSIEEEQYLVMTLKDQSSFYQTSLDGFCYNNFFQDSGEISTLPYDEEEDFEYGGNGNISTPSFLSNAYYTLQQLNYEFPMGWVVENVSNSHFYRCPCNFPEGAEDLEFCQEYEWNYGDDEEPELLYVDGGNGVGVSIYAAHYLSSEKGINYEDILGMFYPNDDWELKSTDRNLASGNGDMVCSKLNFYSTPLGRSEFISLVESYLSGKSSTTARLFRENAGMIYDMGKEIGANPEMVYIIAEKEQAWKDTSFTTSCFNFYGYGVYNGKNSGKCFGSFEEGVETILNYVKNKGSLTEFTKVYSYLGKYLANPGSWKDGGCIYLKLPEIYGANYSRCNASYHCASSDGGAGCVLTTEAEKQAYIDWQAKKILKIRKNIFHLEEEVCSYSGSLDVNAGEASQVPLEQRMNWLFPSGIPKTEAAMAPYLTTITVPVVDINGNRSTHRLRVHTKLASEFTAIFNELANIKFPIKKSDTYVYGWRSMASGTGSRSHHSYGVALDLNSNDNPPTYWNAVPDKNSPYYNNDMIVQIFKAHGFYWGGNWSYKNRDFMHFTYTNH